MASSSTKPFRVVSLMLFEAKDVVSGYGALQVLNGVSVSVEEGEIVSSSAPTGRARPPSCAPSRVSCRPGQARSPSMTWILVTCPSSDGRCCGLGHSARGSRHLPEPDRAREPRPRHRASLDGSDAIRR